MHKRWEHLLVIGFREFLQRILLLALVINRLAVFVRVSVGSLKAVSIIILVLTVSVLVKRFVQMRIFEVNFRSWG